MVRKGRGGERCGGERGGESGGVVKRTWGRGGGGRWDGWVGMRRERGREGEGIPVSEVVSHPYTKCVLK